MLQRAMLRPVREEKVGPLMRRRMALLEKRAASCVQRALFRNRKIIKANHSHEVPQIVKVAITDGLPSYLNWIEDETK